LPQSCAYSASVRGSLTHRPITEADTRQMSLFGWNADIQMCSNVLTGDERE